MSTPGTSKKVTMAAFGLLFAVMAAVSVYVYFDVRAKLKAKAQPPNPTPPTPAVPTPPPGPGVLPSALPKGQHGPSGPEVPAKSSEAGG
ncbi:MAG: hypothetical protein IBJ18_03265 [Phycisphaerales bacterium]|nr:hypothetical protein [Phycisphaerales bacterium]